MIKRLFPLTWELRNIFRAAATGGRSVSCTSSPGKVSMRQMRLGSAESFGMISAHSAGAAFVASSLLFQLIGARISSLLIPGAFLTSPKNVNQDDWTREHKSYRRARTVHETWILPLDSPIEDFDLTILEEFDLWFSSCSQHLNMGDVRTHRDQSV